MAEIPSDVVELIIAVDLNPSDPAEPINVSSVDVRDKGEGGEGPEDWKSLCMQLLMSDDRAGVTSDSISYDEAKKAAARMMGEEETEKDPFSAHRSMMDEPSEEMPERKGGGMQAALERALGIKKKDEEDEED